MADNVIEFSLEAVDNFSRVFGVLGKTLGAAGAVWAATGGTIVAFTKAVAEQIGKFDDLAKRTGVSRTSLMELDYAAQQSGLSLENVTTSIQFLQRGMDDAQFGLGQGSRAFERLGISITDSTGRMKDSQTVMYEVADALQGIQDPAQKTKIAMDLFGKSGAQMLSMMEGGSEGMRAMAADAHFLGVALSDQAVANADAFGDEMVRVTNAIKGASFAVAGEWIPMLTGMAHTVANAIADLRPTLAEFANGFMRAMVGAYVVVEQVITNVTNGIRKFFTAKGFDDFWKRFADGASNAFTWMLETGARSAELLARILWAGFKTAWTAFYEVAKWAWMKVFDFVTGQDLAGTLGEVLFESIPRAAQEHLDEFKSAFGEYKDHVVDTFKDVGSAVAGVFGLSMEGVSTRIDEIISQFQMFGEVASSTVKEHVEPTLLEMYQKLTAANKQRQEELTAEIYFAQTFGETMAATWELLNLQLLNTSQLTSQLIMDTYNTVSAGIGQSVADAIVSGAKLGEALKNVLKQATANVIAMLVQTGVQRMILSALNIKANAQEAASSMATGLAQVYTNSFQSAAAIPLVGWAIAPGIAAANLAVATAGATAAGTAGAGLGAGLAAAGGAAHGGLEYVPRETTYLLDEGERVLSPNQNRDLTDFLASGGGGGTVINVEKISVLENATSFDALMQMTPAQLREVTAGKIIEALNQLDRQGIRPVFAERTGR